VGPGAACRRASSTTDLHRRRKAGTRGGAVGPRVLQRHQFAPLSAAAPPVVPSSLPLGVEGRPRLDGRRRWRLLRVDEARVARCSIPWWMRGLPALGACWRRNWEGKRLFPECLDSQLVRCPLARFSA